MGDSIPDAFLEKDSPAIRDLQEVLARHGLRTDSIAVTGGKEGELTRVTISCLAMRHKPVNHIVSKVTVAAEHGKYAGKVERVLSLEAKVLQKVKEKYR